MESPLSFDSTENFRKRLLLKNLKPYKVDGFYGPIDKASTKEISLADYSVIDTTSLDTTSKLIEPSLIGQNKYTPGSEGFGQMISININKGTQTNNGVYDYSKSFFSILENFGKNKETELLVQNQYGPEGQQSKTTVTPNINFQTKSNEGNYGYSDSIKSSLETRGNELERFLRVLNKYGPEKGAGQYGDSVLFEVKTLGTNTGEYRNQTDAQGSLLETEGQLQEIILYTKNKYGPAIKGSKSYGNTVPINDEYTLGSNYGQYQPTESSGDNSQLEILGEQNLVILFNNTYQPNNPIEATPNDNVEQKPNRGEFPYKSFANVNTTDSQTFYYAKNRYNSGEGTFTTPEEVTYINETINSPYLLSDTTFAFIPSEYLPITILKTDNVENINGSEGKLSQDSSLAQIGAKQLQKEFKARVAFELLQQTLGKSTLTNSTISPDSGGISVKPKLNPFDVLGVLSNKLPIIQRDYKITSSSNAAIESVGFIGRLSGLYSPYSIIPNQYFDYPNRNFLSQSVDNPVGAALGAINNLVNNITSPFIDSSSELFIANTSPAVRGLLFDQLFYNNYRPNYLLDSLQSPNLLAPKGNYYVGNNKNFIRDAVSPKPDQPKGRFGKANVGPVFSYSEISKEYEGPKISEQPFGVESKPFYDSVGIQGGFTWIAKDNLYSPGKFVGPGNKQINEAGTDTVFEKSFFGPEYNKTKSTEFGLTEGSILDVTQKLIQAANDSSRRSEHVGNAINQVSKVFKDGLTEMTKGSKVIRYTTPTSIDPSQSVMGYEYCRLFTKDRPYYTFNELQKRGGNIRNFSNSVLDNTYNLNIAPMGGKDSTNLKIDDKGRLSVKKYMFSIENLAWKTSNKSGYRVDDLPACEIGPNGGRIMWFPPYDLKYDDSSIASWDGVTFLGRTEPIYIYKKTERSGSLSFKIVVDHPSILNLIVDKELEKQTNSESTKIIDSFFAGCLTYDPIDLLKKYRYFSLSDVFEATEALNTRQELKQVVNETANTTLTGEKTTNTGDISGDKDQSTNTSIVNELNKASEKGGQFNEIILLFGQSAPDNAGEVSDKDYDTLYGSFIGDKSVYLNAVTTNTTFPDGGYIKYGTNTTIGTLPSDVNAESAGSQYIIFKKSSLENLYTDILKEKSDFDDFLKKIQTALEADATVSFSVVSSANANGDDNYNEKLSKRRFDSVLKTVLKNATLSKYYDSKKLIIKSDPQGKNSILKTDKYSNIDCAKSFNNTNVDGKASIQAMLCRRVTITELKVTPSTTIPEEQKSTSGEKDKPEGVNPQSLAADNKNVDNITPQYTTVNTTTKVNSAKAKTAGLTKKLLRKLLSECSYFEMIQETQPMLYDGIKSKIKNFNPTFHSITPEGLNSRLTFLNQCLRPGDTIPTVVSAGNQGQTALQYNDVFNSAFGTPPICVIRVGDFYNTKAIIDNLKFDYNDAKFDLNPEGIGVQPMMVDVTIGLKFIGGHGLKGPVSTLQNALSFNYYANTEMYDERAEETEVDKYKQLDSEILEDIKNEYGILTPKKNDGSDAGNTIGTVITNFLDTATSAVTGTIQYKDKMTELIKITGEYFNSIINNFEKIQQETLIGGIVLYNSEKQYSNGYFNWLSGNTTNVVNIFGKPNLFTERITQVINQAKSDVDDETSPILGGLEVAGFDLSEKRKIKRKLKEMIDAKSSKMVGTLSNAQRNIINNELSLIKITDQINYVSNKVDGYINNRGGAVVYDLSGNTGYVDPSSLGTTNTYDELVTDFLKVGTDMNTYNQKLDEYKIVPTGTSYTYNTDFKFELYLKEDIGDTKGYESVQKGVNVFFMVLGKEILDGYEKFVNELVTVIPKTSVPPYDEEQGKWKKFLLSNLGFNYDYDLNTSTKRTSGLYQDFERSKKKTEDLFKNCKDNFLNTFIPNGVYSPFNEKQRVMDYKKQNPTVTSNEQQLREMRSPIDVPGNQFNLKKTLN